MPLLSDVAQKKKIDFFLTPLDKDARILEIGSGSGWVGDYLKTNGWTNYDGLDLEPPADIVGDITQWQSLGMQANSYDVIVAFEVVEHVDLYAACQDLLKPNGKLLVTTPAPHADWFMKILELVGLNQKRTSPHCNLHYLKSNDKLDLDLKRTVAGLSQWGIFVKQA